MSKAIIFDMDGTIVDLYGVENWLDMLLREDETPYLIAKPMYNMNTLNNIIHELKRNDWIIIVTSWLSKDATPQYKKKIREAKKVWLQNNNFPYDEIHLIQYGRTKADSTRHKYNYQILVDDDEKIRNGWHLGDTINAEYNILSALRELAEM